MAAKSTDWRPGPTVCRCCLSEGCYKDISTEYFWMGKREVYSEMLLESFNLTISYSQSGGPNSNSRLICEPCISRLRDASDFKRQVQECEKTFTQHLDPGSSSLNDFEVEVPLEQLNSPVKVEKVKVERQASDDDDDFDARADFDDDDDDMDDQPLTKLASKIPKKESVDLLDLLDNAKATTVKRKSATKTKAPPAKKSKPSKREVKPTTSKTVKLDTKKKASRPRPATSIWSMTLMERENAAILIQSTTVRPFTYKSFPLRFTCFYCDQVHPELKTLLDHTNDHTVPDRTEMLKTVLRKGKKTIKVDISELKCKLCDAPFSSVDDVRRHLSTSHGKKFNIKSGNGMTSYYLKDGIFSCHICSQTFTSFFLLNKHINVHFNNEICEWCGKGFISHQRLIQHQEIHLRGKFHCDKCNIFFDSPSKFKYHNDRLHGKPNKVNNIYICQLCSTRFDHHYEKMRHMNEIHGVKLEYSCETCKSVFKTRKALSSHNIKYHIQSISCEICKKPFAERAHLRKHMAMHTEERNFPCPLCNKSYKYEKNVKSHMRVHNPDWKFACGDCWVGFSKKMEFKKHMQETHKNKLVNK